MWFAVAISCAFLAALADMYAKKNLADDIDRELVLFARFFYSLPVLWAAVLFNGIPQYDPSMFRIYLLAVPLEVAAAVFFINAIHAAPMSLVIPLLSFTPVFILLTGPLILAEYPNIYGVAGVLLIVAGSYIINISQARRGFFAPFLMIIQNRGSAMMLATAFIFSMTSVLGKYCIQKSDPFFFAATYYSSVTVLLFIHLLVRGELRHFMQKELLINGMLFSGMLLTHVVGLKLTYASYLIAVKRTSILFSIRLGMMAFREKNIAERFAGGLIMVAGVLCITLLGK